MPDAAPATNARPRPPSGRGQRLMVYLTGVVIGLALLGYFRARSADEARARQAATNHGTPPPSTPGSDAPPDGMAP